MDIQAVIKVLNKELGASITSDYYNRIEEWRQWWAGYVKAFHKFSETTDSGKKKERTLYSLKMAKKVCEDWACRDGSLDVTGERLTAEKVPYFWAFRASDRQRREAKMAAKTLMWEHIKGNVRRVE